LHPTQCLPFPDNYSGIDWKRGWLVPGAAVFVIALKHDDGKLTSGRLYVEKDGIKPHM
jgi:hypothetical protein